MMETFNFVIDVFTWLMVSVLLGMQVGRLLNERDGGR